MPLSDRSEDKLVELLSMVHNKLDAYVRVESLLFKVPSIKCGVGAALWFRTVNGRQGNHRPIEDGLSVEDRRLV